MSFPFYFSFLFSCLSLLPNRVLPSLFCVGGSFVPLFFIIAENILNLE